MNFPRWLIALSCKVNYLLGGRKNVSICAEMYDKKDKKIYKTLCCMTDKLFFFDPNHCKNAWRIAKINGVL